jgi:quercetin dioxygenase-like cupin family protein
VNKMTTHPDTIVATEVYLPVQDLKTEMPFFLTQLGFRLDEIFPADDPAVAVISGHGVRIRLDRNANMAPGKLRLRCENAVGFAGGQHRLVSPSGNIIEIVEANPALDMPETQHSFLVRHLRDSDSWVIGRAGMRYRDLIPDRLGGSIIASHIRIPDGGPVPDMVHYHIVGFQLIFCYRGWVRLVYEDQGAPFILEEGCCVIQPPQIRHRVLEASDNVEVLEIGVPAEHVTTIDHEMELPNSCVNPDRDWQGTRFIHHKQSEAVWAPWRIPGWESRDTGIAAATRNVAGVHVARPAGQTGAWTSHTTDILFTFMKEGEMSLQVTGHEPHRLTAGDAFVLPPFLKSRYVDPSPDCELIEVTLQADFMTQT